MILFNERHLRSVLTASLAHHNRGITRKAWGIDMDRIPVGRGSDRDAGEGLNQEYRSSCNQPHNGTGYSDEGDSRWSEPVGPTYCGSQERYL